MVFVKSAFFKKAEELGISEKEASLVWKHSSDDLVADSAANVTATIVPGLGMVMEAGKLAFDVKILFKIWQLYHGENNFLAFTNYIRKNPWPPELTEAGGVFLKNTLIKAGTSFIPLFGTAVALKLGIDQTVELVLLWAMYCKRGVEDDIAA